jgi:multimeric flavodoxin WrbA
LENNLNAQLNKFTWKNFAPVCTGDDLREADGLLMGSPTRYGNMTAEMKALIDSTASLWLFGAMEGNQQAFSPPLRPRTAARRRPALR